MAGLIDSCFLCEKLQFGESVFCRVCRRELSESDPIHRRLGGLDVFSLLHYVQPASGLLKLCKNPRFKELTRDLAAILAKRVALELLEDVCGVIPMPSRMFGNHDHAYYAAEAVAAVFRAPLACRFLERASPEPQKEKDVTERSKVKLLRREALPLSDFAGNGIWLLVDDVVTTGATLTEAWRLLGKPRAAALALASTPRHENFAGLSKGLTRGNYWGNLIKQPDAVAGIFTSDSQPIRVGEDHPSSSRGGTSL